MPDRPREVDAFFRNDDQVIEQDERPLACVVLADDAGASAAELRDYLGDKVVKWWLPERWAFIDEVPKTSVGKFDKKVLRSRYADGEYEVETLS